MINTTQTIDKRIDTLVHKRVIEVMREILSDPDYGLELNSDFVARLKKSIDSKSANQVVSLDSILKRYKI